MPAFSSQARRNTSTSKARHRTRPVLARETGSACRSALVAACDADCIRFGMFDAPIPAKPTKTFHVSQTGTDRWNGR
ncbi:MAG: hypothetical protein AAGG72_07730, partial [Pseudomonadota bacterium]